MEKIHFEYWSLKAVTGGVGGGEVGDRKPMLGA